MASHARGRAVKNLGWLLRNWKSVDRFIVTEGGGGSGSGNDAYLIAKLRDGETYETDFASKTVLYTWINRPVFKGSRIRWFGHEMIVGQGKDWKELGEVYERGYHLAGRHERGDNPRRAKPPMSHESSLYPRASIVASSASAGPAGRRAFWHTVTATVSGRRYVMKTYEEEGGYPSTMSVLGPSGRELPRGTKHRMQLGFGADEAVAARAGYIGVSKKERDRQSHEFTYKPHDIGDGFIVKWHAGMQVWLIYYKGKVQSAGATFHGTPGFEKLHDALTKAKRMKEDNVIMEGHAREGLVGTPSAARHERGDNPRVTGKLKQRMNAVLGRGKK